MKLIRFPKVQKHPYVISWDNPEPSNSYRMYRALERLGTVTRPQTKTSIVLLPHPSTHPRDVRQAIKANLSRLKGNGFYANLGSRRSFEVGAKTKFLWKKITPTLQPNNALQQTARGGRRFSVYHA